MKDVAYFVDTYGMNGYKVAGNGDAPLLSMLKMEVAQEGSTILSHFDRSAILNLMKYFPTGPFVGLDISNGAFTFLRFDYSKLPTGSPSSGDPLADADLNYKATPVLFRVGTVENPWKQYTHVINTNGTVTKDTVGSVDIETLTGYYLGSKNYALTNDDIFGKSPIITNKAVFVSLLKTVVEYKVATAAEVQTAFGVYMPDVVSAALGTSPTTPALPEWQALADPQADTLIKAYIAHFGRPADPEGLTYWVETFKSTGQTMVDLLGNFGNSTEYKNLYGSASTDVRINSIYQYLFNRNAEPDGLKFWGDALNSGKLTINNIAYSILNGAQGQDAAVINAKVAAARTFITALNTQTEVEMYKGDAATLNARKWLSTIADNQASNSKAMAVANEVISSLATGVEPVLTKHGLALGVAFGGPATDRALAPWSALGDNDASAALKAYIAYFGRPADPNGLTSAVEHFNKGGTMEQLTVHFGASDEYKALSAGVTTQDKVNSIYKYLFNRDAEADGRKFWADAIDNGTLNLGNAAMSILNGAQNSDAMVIAGKVAAAAAFVGAFDRQSELDLYSNGTAALNARKWLAHASANEQTNIKLIGIANDAIASLQSGIDPVLAAHGFF